LRKLSALLGYVNGRYFLLMTGVGFGGKVTYTVKKDSMKRFGILGYLLMGLRLAFGYESFQACLKIDGQLENIRALHIVVGNTKLYGSIIKFTWRARCDDGLLDVCVVRQPGMLKRVVVLLDFLLHREQRRKWVSYSTCQSVEIRTHRPVAV
jgi:diacylglycerol kinase family enzyme